MSATEMKKPNECNVTLSFDNEDHTLGNVIRQVLLGNRQVLFAAYKVPHPLKRTLEIRIQTTGITAMEAAATCIDDVINDLEAFNNAFDIAISREH